MNNFKEGYLFKIKSRNMWCYEYYLNGKKKRIHSKKKTVLQKKIAELHEKMYKGLYVIADNVTIPQIAHKLNNDKFELNKIQTSSYGRNKYSISIIEKSNLNSIPIQKVTTNDLDVFSKYVIKYSNSTIEKVFIQIKSAFKFALFNNIINKDITTYYERPKSSKIDRKTTAFTIDEHKKFLKAIPDSIYYMQYLIALNTGMRMGEINALHIDDIDLINKKININKTVS